MVFQPHAEPTRPAVLVAAFVVKEMPIEPLRWAVVVGVLYASALLLRAATKGDVPKAWWRTRT